MTAAYGIVGQPHHLSVHPGGVVITPGPLTDFVPVQWAPKGFLITQFDHGDVEALGLPKIDCLGIRALTVLADAAELVRRDHDAGLSPGGHPAGRPADRRHAGERGYGRRVPVRIGGRPAHPAQAWGRARCATWPWQTPSSSRVPPPAAWPAASCGATGARRR